MFIWMPLREETIPGVAATQERGRVRTTAKRNLAAKIPNREYRRRWPQEAAGTIGRVSGRGLPPASKLDPVLKEHTPL